MRKIEKIIIGTAVLAVGAGVFRDEIKYAEQVSNISTTIAGLTLSYDFVKAIVGDYFGKKEKQSARIIDIYNQEAGIK